MHKSIIRELCSITVLYWLTHKIRNEKIVLDISSFIPACFSGRKNGLIHLKASTESELLFKRRRIDTWQAFSDLRFVFEVNSQEIAFLQKIYGRNYMWCRDRNKIVKSPLNDLEIRKTSVSFTKMKNNYKFTLVVIVIKIKPSSS